jgi:predicted DNA-binding protein
MDGGKDMKRKRDSRVAQRLERDARDESAWVNDPAPIRKQTLGTQVTIRLSPQLAARLRGIAKAQGVGYTSLIRGWVEAQLRSADQETAIAVMPDGYLSVSAGTHTRFGPYLQVSPGQIREVLA